MAALPPRLRIRSSALVEISMFTALAPGMFVPAWVEWMPARLTNDFAESCHSEEQSDEDLGRGPVTAAALARDASTPDSSLQVIL